MTLLRTEILVPGSMVFVPDCGPGRWHGEPVWPYSLWTRPPSLTRPNRAFTTRVVAGWPSQGRGNRQRLVDLSLDRIIESFMGPKSLMFGPQGFNVLSKESKGITCHLFFFWAFTIYMPKRTNASYHPWIGPQDVAAGAYRPKAWRLKRREFP